MYDLFYQNNPFNQAYHFIVLLLILIVRELGVVLLLKMLL